MAEDYAVEAGESVNSVAYEHGFFWETLWNDSGNAQLKQKRKDPDVLLAGDILHIPDLTQKKEAAPTEQKTRFRLRGTPAKFVAVLTTSPEKDDKAPPEAHETWDFVDPEAQTPKAVPLKNTDFELYGDGTLLKSAKTDGNGRLEATLKPNARAGVLIIRRGTPQETAIEVNFRHMDPIATVEGVCKRLRNLGYGCPLESTATRAVKMAVADFQRAQGMTVNGDIDDALRDKLKQAYGG